ncbi:M48 family metalloprotease [Acidithiobacillus ferrooxidans]|uniref:M48 family metalloprotease n=1 Tax=Acidithiobacillus ferrooxidans TaxID=920 RepID=UPI000B246C53|nr:M48 family metalloprotease [Acidithiobacillus ferrooxidans]
MNAIQQYPLIGLWPLVAASIGISVGALLPSHEISKHFSTLTKVIFGMSLALGAAELVNYFSTSTSSVPLEGVTYSGNAGGFGGPGTLPWDSFFSIIWADMSGNVARWAAGIAVVVSGILMMWGEQALCGTNSTPVSRETWEADLAALMARDLAAPGWRRVFRSIPAKLKVLPAWWPVHYGAWSYMRYIILSRHLQEDAPTVTRRYVLGHELGHIRNGHTALNYLYPVLAAIYITSLWCFIYGGPGIQPVAAAIMFLLIVSKSSLLWFPNHREFQADDYAARLVGQPNALEGSLWMAHHGHDLSRLRRKRLARLGYNPSESRTDQANTAIARVA